MKILILANSIGGLFRFRKELIERLFEYGEENGNKNQIFAAVPDGKSVNKIEELGCTYIEMQIDRRGINPIIDIKLFLRMNKIIRRIKPDMIITYTIKPNVYGGILARLKKIPYAANITGLGTAFERNGPLKTFIILLYKIALKKVKVIFFENEENRKIFVNLNIVPDLKTCKLNGAGVNLDEFSFAELPEEETIHFIFVGRLMKEKGIDELFGAMEQLYAEGEDCVLDVLGGFEENYQAVIEKHQQTGWLNYYGYQYNVQDYIKNAHCAVLPSWHEGMSNTLLEAGAMGRPLIVSDIPGCREAVVDGKNGYLVKVHSQNDLYDKMKCFLGISDMRRKEMGRYSNEHIKKNFNKKDVVEKTVEQLFKEDI